MKVVLKVVCSTVLWLSLNGFLHAESLYVIDRILLGVHQLASEESPLLKSIPSGTLVEILEKRENFARIKLADGTQGWVSTKYLMKEQPASVKYEKLLADYKKSKESADALTNTLSKQKKDIQLLRDEVSNAKTTIRELKKAKATPVAAKPDPEEALKLQQAEQRIKELTQQLEQLGKEKITTTVVDKPVAVALKQAEEKNAALQARIELALSNLSGEKAPTAEELAGMRPDFPLWYWLLMFASLVIGIGAGVSWVDFRLRKRHGGFRL